ncbi:MAG: lysophospholipid acyltransferase family protein [Bacteroidales bacterium]|nr:lysophospholipid acyltransferase family protein [Bacteroidales bacterium]
MQKIGYKMLGCALAAMGRLPLKALYALSSLIYVVAYYVVRYRRRVVSSNLERSFPELSAKERRKIERGFYRHFADVIVETLHVEYMTDEETRRHITFEGMDIVDGYFDQGRSIVAYFSHCGNWEWVTSITLWSRYKARETAEFCQVYRPLRNKWFDDFFLRLRSRYNPRGFPKKTVLRDLLRLKRDKRVYITAFMSDQKPSHGDPTEVVEFLSQPTAMITGTETLARKLGDAVVYLDMYKEGRGRYRVVVRDLTDKVAATTPFQLTDIYARLLEDTIRRNPSIWLWSHKRWKHPVTLPSSTPNLEANEASSSNNP